MSPREDTRRDAAHAAPPQPAAVPLPSLTLPPELARVLRDYETAWGAATPRRAILAWASDWRDRLAWLRHLAHPYI